MAALLIATLGLLALGGCADTKGSNPGANDSDCVDADSDGFGTGCNRGTDCNDFNPQVITCDCTEGNFAGCPCQEGTTESCFDGMAGQEGVGQCRGGMRRCEGGLWSPCGGQTPPVQELCDGKDNDCDGSTDEELPVGPCGDCNMLCDQDSIGRGGSRGWDVDEENDGLVETPQGGLELPDGNQTQVTYLWAANSEEGTVSKVDSETGREIARYVSALRLDFTMPDPLERCPNTNDPRGNCPSRTAVDLRGDVWVANRNFLGQGSVTKIANRDCIDRNGNGQIETSSDANGNGEINIADSAEFLGERDECILFTTKIGGFQAIPRALAIDPFAPVRGVGSAWVGAYSEQRYYQVAADTGEVLRSVNVPHRPYGAVMDRFGVLWSTDLGASNANIGTPRGLVSIVSQSDPAEVKGPFAIRSSDRCAGSYGITLDGEDNVWLGSFSCSSAFRYTPSQDSWLTVPLPPNTGYARGITADRDGWVYVGVSNLVNNDATPVGKIVRFRHEDGSQMQTFDFTRNAQGTIGVGMDFQGRVWGINQDTGTATRLDPNSGALNHFPIGDGPYTYSDFTGYTLQNFTAPQGNYRRVFNGCPTSEKSIWERIQWEADTPVGTTVSVRVKAANTLDELIVAPYIGPFTESPANLQASDVPDSKFLEVEVTLTTDTAGVTPTLWNLQVVWTCPPIQ